MTTKTAREFLYTMGDIHTLAGCSWPDTEDADEFLRQVAEDAWDWVTSQDEKPRWDDIADQSHDIADEAVYWLMSRSTYRLWLVFADLCAWQEDLSEYGGPDPDMTKNATVALYMIANRLCANLIAEMVDEDWEDHDE